MERGVVVGRWTCALLLAGGFLAGSLSCSIPATAMAPGMPATATSPATAPTTQPAAPEPLRVVRQTVNEQGVTVATLSNALTVIIEENHTSPVVTVRCHVRAGGMLEGPWLGSGVSHLLEHLVAKGATRGPGHVEGPRASRDRLDAIGAQSNAYTSLDETTYFIDAAAGRTDEAIEIIADWMARPEITEADFRREHGVVQRELEMGRDDVPRQFQYAHMANFYGTHPAGVPVIGHLGALRGLTWQDVLAYHRRMYVPRNMVFVVVGDVDGPAVLDKVLSSFAGFDAGASAPAVLPEVPRLAGVRRVVMSAAAARDVAEQVSFRSVPLIHPDLYPLDVLSYILTNGESSRLNQSLKRQRQLVTSIDSSSWTPEWGAGQFVFSFRAEPDKADAAERALLEELRRVVEQGVGEEELAKAKRQKVADFVYGRQSVQSQAAMLASDYLSAGDVDFSRRYTDRIQAVTAEQVRSAARRYFTFDALAITRLVPAGSPLAPRPGVPQTRAVEPVRFQLANGLTVVLNATASVDLVAMNLAVLGGVMAEDEATNGLGTLMTELSLKGAGERSADEIAEFFDRRGGAIATQCGNNTFMWEATVLKADAPEALAILADVVIRPAFATEELERLRPSLLAAIGRLDEQWETQLQRFFRRAFYAGSPYRLMTIGSAPAVAGADRQAISAHHARWVKAGSGVLSVFGNFDADAMRQTIELHFADMPAGAGEPHAVQPRRVAPGGERHVLGVDNQQAAIMIGWPGMRVTDAADRDAVSVLDTIISGYELPRGWLHEQLRGRQLVYVVHAYNWTGWLPGAFVVYAATQPEKAEEVVAIIRRNVARTLEEPFTTEQIAEAVNIILTAELLGAQTMRELAMQATLDELYGLGFDYRRSLEARLRAVTPADLHRVARKYLAGPAVETITTPRPRLVDPTGRHTRQAEPSTRKTTTQDTETTEDTEKE